MINPYWERRLEAIRDILSRRQTADMICSITPDGEAYQLKVLTVESEPRERRQCTVSFMVDAADRVCEAIVWTTDAKGLGRHRKVLTDQYWTQELFKAACTAVIRKFAIDIAQELGEQLKTVFDGLDPESPSSN